MQWIGALLCLLGLCLAQEAIAHPRSTKAASHVKRTLAAAAVTPSATLAWDYAGTQQSGFQASRCMATSLAMDCATDVDVAGVLAPALRQWTDTPLVAGQRYCWRLRALAANGTASEYSNRVCTTIPAVVPPPPPIIPAPSNLRVLGP